MFNRLKYAYHAAICERLIKEDKSYTDAYMKHKMKVNKLVCQSFSKIANKAVK